MPASSDVNYQTQPLAIKNTVERRRKAMGLTQEQLAEQLGVPQGHISQIENGTIELPRKEIISKLLRFFHCQLGDLFYVSEDSHRTQAI